MKVLDFLTTFEEPVIPPFEKLAQSDARTHFKIADIDEVPAYQQKEVNEFIEERMI